MRGIMDSRPGRIGRLMIFAAVCFAVAVIALVLMLTGPHDAPVEPTIDAPVVTAPASDPVPGRALSEWPQRMFYKGDGERSWGTSCALPGGGHVSVDHVTINGTPVVGPTDPVTARDELSDWSILGVDPETLDHRDYPMLAPGMVVTIEGFPARDRDGERVPGIIYMDDPDPETLFVWLELLDSPARGVDGEGVVGGFSGSCVIANGKPVAVVSANGFSVIENTSNTWAKIVPIRSIIRAAQGLEQEAPPRAIGIMGRARPVPKIETGRWGMAQ